MFQRPSLSRSLLTWRMRSCCQIVCAAACTSLRSASVSGLFGFTSTEIVVALGTSWRRSSSHGALSTELEKTTPVALPPGAGDQAVPDRWINSATSPSAPRYSIATFWPSRSLLPSGPGGTRSRSASRQRATCCGETRSPASLAARPRRERPPGRHAAEQRDELASPHANHGI